MIWLLDKKFYWIDTPLFEDIWFYQRSCTICLLVSSVGLRYFCYAYMLQISYFTFSCSWLLRLLHWIIYGTYDVVENNYLLSWENNCLLLSSECNCVVDYTKRFFSILMYYFKFLNVFYRNFDWSIFCGASMSKKCRHMFQ